MDMLRFQSLKKNINQGIVGVILFSAYAFCSHFTGINQISVLINGILNTSVRINHQSFYNVTVRAYNNLVGK